VNEVRSGVGGRVELLYDLIVSEASDEDGFVSGSMAVGELDLTRVTMETVGEKTDESLVGGGIHGWRGDADAKFARKRTGDGIGGCARLEFD
jgi:hypothetical protein